MGLLLSIFVVCVGVIEALSCYQHFQYGVLRYATNLYENARKRNSVFLNYKSRRSKLKSEISIEEADEKPKVPPARFSPEFEAVIKDIAKSQELHLLQLQQQHLQLQLQIARLKEEKETLKEKEKKHEECIAEKKDKKEIEVPKKFGKEEKTDLVKKLLNKAPKATRSISMPEQILTKKDLEIAKIIDELAIEPIDEIDIPVDVADSEIITKEFEKIFDESENALKASKRLIEKRPSLTEVAFLTESADGKVFEATKHDFAAQTVETSELEKPVEKKQFEEATPNQELFFAQKALMADSSVQKDLETVPHLDKSTSIDLDEPGVVNQCTSMDFDAIVKSASTTTSEDLIPINKSTSMDFDTISKSASTTTSEDVIPISKSTSMDFDTISKSKSTTTSEDLFPINKSTSMDFETLNPVNKSTSTNFDIATPLNKSTSIDYEELNPVSKSTSMTFDDLIPINKSTSMDFENISKSTSTENISFIPVNKSTSMDFSNLIPINKSTSMDFGNILKDSSTQMNFFGRNSSTDLEDFYSVSESEDEETIHVELKVDENKKKKKAQKNVPSLREKDFKNFNEGKKETAIPKDADTSVDDNNNDDGIGPEQTEPFEKTDISLAKKIKTKENSIRKIVSKNVEGQAILMKDQSEKELDKSDSTLSDDSSGNSKKSKQEGKQEAFWLIFSGEYTKAMSKDWHSGHFSCWQCDEALTGQRYVLRDDHPYCIKCYESVFANVCEECNKIIGIDSKDLSYKDKHWHEACFLCNKCRVSLVDKQFGSKADKIYCGNCYDAQFASRCDGCGEIFRAGTKKMEYKTRQWHEKCFCCCVCKTPIGTKSFIPREQEIYCATCYEEKFATRCVKCNKIITSGGVTYKNEPWHRECFTCTNCNTSLAGQRFTSRDEKPYCADCFGELFAKRCTACSRPITGIGGTRFISFEDRHWHNDCFICASCKTSLVGRGFITDADDIICPECAKQKLM